MKYFNTGLRYFFLLFVITALAGCGGSRSSGSANTISGIASKGPINGGNVEVFALHADGTKDVLLGTATTGADGLYTVGIGNYSDPVLVEVWGGTYVDEATGVTLSNTLLRAAVTSSQGNVSAAVTPFTELATSYAEQLGGLTLDNITAANALVSDLFGGIDIIATEPVDVLSTPTGGVRQEEIDYGLMLAGLSQMVANDPALNNVTDVLAEFAGDMADGVLDETAGDFSTALTDFLASASNQTGITSINSMSFDTAPAQVTGLSVIAAGSNQINLSWTASTDDGSSQANLVYEICQSNSTGGCDTFTVSKTTFAGAITSNVSGLGPLTTHYFKLRAKDEVGNIGSASVEASGITDSIGTANAPTFSPVAGTYGSAQNVSISSTTAGATQCYTTDGVTDPACDASALCTTGTTYTGMVSVSTTQSLRAMACMVGYTASSLTSAAYVIDTTTTPVPGNAGTITATNVTSTSITLNWTKATDAVSAQANLMYFLYRSATNNIGTVAEVEANGTMIVGGMDVAGVPPDDLLMSGTTYYYNVMVINEAGNKAVYTMLSQNTLGGPYTYTRPDNVNNLITDSFALTGAEPGVAGTVAPNKDWSAATGQYYIEAIIPAGGSFKVEIDKNINFTFNSYTNWSLVDNGSLWTFVTSTPGTQRIDINTGVSGVYGYVVYREATDGVTFGPGYPRFVNAY